MLASRSEHTKRQLNYPRHICRFLDHCNSGSNHEAPPQIRIDIFSCCLAELCSDGFGAEILVSVFLPSPPVSRRRGLPRTKASGRNTLDVELIFLRGGSRTVSALIGGSVDFIIGSDLGITTAILQGAALTRVGVTTNTLGYSMVSQPAIKLVRDLKGKVIGITPGRDAAYARVVKLLRDNGMDSNKDVTFLSVGDGGPAARVAALSSGVIHATMFTPPSDMISEKAGMRILTKIDVANIGGGLNTSTAVLQKSRPQLLVFCAATWKRFST